MGFPIENYLRRRPFLYHLTARANLDRIARTRRLDCAASLLNAASASRQSRVKRPEAIHLKLDHESVSIRDQKPLHQGHIEFLGGWTFADVIADLNRRVFFWPGWDRGPIDYGTRHFRRYQGEGPVVLKLSFRDLLEANEGVHPAFCRYNSGSPRTYPMKVGSALAAEGRKSPRGPDTFVTAEAARFNPGEVVEVTFLEGVYLPHRVEVGPSMTGPWSRWILSEGPPAPAPPEASGIAHPPGKGC